MYKRYDPREKLRGTRVPKYAFAKTSSEEASNTNKKEVDRAESMTILKRTPSSSATSSPGPVDGRGINTASLG